MCLLNKLPKFCFRNLLKHRPNITSNFFKACYGSQYDLDLIIKGVSLKNYIKHIEEEFKQASKATSLTASRKLQELQPIIQILDERKTLAQNINNVSELLNENDEDIKRLALEEKDAFEQKIKEIDEELMLVILPSDEEDHCNSIVLEVNTGIGGQEAMLFANELFEMYCNFADFKGWQTQIVEYTKTDLGGIRHASALINGAEPFRYFRHEAGVHRVQRIPSTEKAGRVHTSTVSVLALPQPSGIDIKIDNKELKIETKRASGAGGQHVNTTDSAVRILHLPTGLSVDCQVDRSQIKNKQLALAKLKALLYQRELEHQTAKNQATRNSQVRTNFRNEKIRTYNFPQDRVTDHRLQRHSVHNLKGFFQGDEALNELINKLDLQFKSEMLVNIARNLNKSN